MQSIPERSRKMGADFQTSFIVARLAGADVDTATAIASQHMARHLEEFQDELLEAQRAAGVALAQALNMAGGK